MTTTGWIQIALFCAVVLALVKPLGAYMTRVFTGERTVLSPVLAPVERGLYRVAGIDARHEQTWLGYGLAMLAFHLLGFLLLYAVLRLQDVLPFNPMGQSAVAPDLAFNTAASRRCRTSSRCWGSRPRTSSRPRPASRSPSR